MSRGGAPYAAPASRTYGQKGPQAGNVATKTIRAATTSAMESLTGPSFLCKSKHGQTQAQA
jgi:hypothetical protein